MRRRLSLLLLAMVLAAIVAAPAHAACKPGGKTYPEGTTYSNFVCKDGKWVKRR